MSPLQIAHSVLLLLAHVPISLANLDDGGGAYRNLLQEPQAPVAHQVNHLSSEGGFNGGVRDVHGEAATASTLSLAEDTGVPSMSAADIVQNTSPPGRDLSHLSVLQNARPEDVKLEPYPYILLKNALPKEIYDHLAKTYPNDKTLFSISGKTTLMKPNFRYDIRSAQTMVNRDKLDPMWIDFVQYHISPAFYQDVVRVFGPALEKRRPDFIKDGTVHNLMEKKSTMRYAEDQSTDLTMDCQVGMNSPVSRKSSVRGPHHDTPGELYGGLLYFRNPADKSIGGDLQVLACKGGKCKEVPESEKRKRGMSTSRNHEHFDYRDLTVAATAKYKANTYVMFINTLSSVHAVTPRHPTKFSRKLVNFVAEMVKRNPDGSVFIKPNNAAKLAGKHN